MPKNHEIYWKKYTLITYKMFVLFFLQLIFRNSLRFDKWLVTYALGTRRNAFTSLSVTFTDVNHNQNVLRQTFLRFASKNVYEYLFTRTDRRSGCKRRSVVLWTQPKCAISHPFIVGVFAKQLLTSPWLP